tara:strand:- start:4208 stop:4444 length:237 start_codon:yes stop_codon:yes gene_type:complete
MTWEEIIKELKWPEKLELDGKRYLLFKVIGKTGIYRNPDVEKDLRLTVEEANNLLPKRRTFGTARQWRGDDPNNPFFR